MSLRQACRDYKLAIYRFSTLSSFLEAALESCPAQLPLGSGVSPSAFLLPYV